jgi:cytochrome c-type biogenesis protein CcmH
VVAVGAAVAIPLVALGIYLATGSPDALDPARRQQDVSMKEIEAMVQGLADRLERNPEDVDGWKMLGRSYTVMGRFAEAASAYSKAAARAPRDPQLLVDLADALAMARGQKLAGEPEELVLRALQIDPKNLKGLALAGTAAFEKSDFAGAARYWERMLPLLPADADEDRKQVQANVDEAKVRAGNAPAAGPGRTGPSKGPEKKGAAAASIQGTVKLAPALKDKVSPEDTVFIFARAAEGPPMPLAVLRKKVRELPAKFALDDSMAMTPALKLSSFPRVIVGARVAKSGTATPQPGDLQGHSAPMAAGARGVDVVIDEEVKPK